MMGRTPAATGLARQGMQRWQLITTLHDAAAAGAGPQIVLNDSVVRELSQQLVRVGSNLNQVTRLAHIEAREGGVDTAGLGRMVAVIDQTRATIAELDSRLEAMSRP